MAYNETPTTIGTIMLKAHAASEAIFNNKAARRAEGQQVQNRLIRNNRIAAVASLAADIIAMTPLAEKLQKLAKTNG